MKDVWVLIGGHGFIGQHLTRFLVEKGATVVRFGVHKRTGTKASSIVDLCLDDNGFEPHSEIISAAKWVIYLAHRGRPSPEISDCKTLERECLQPLRNSLQYFRDLPLEQFVYLSTGGAMYGSRTKRKPHDEEDPCSPVSDYGRIKLKAEQLIRDSWQSIGKPFLIVRPANGYGWSGDRRLDAGFIPMAIRNVIQGIEVPVFGIPGTTRDYIHISDLSRGISLLAKRGRAGQVYHLGTGVGHNNKEILDLLEPLAKKRGYQVQIRGFPRRSCDVEWVVLSTQKASRDCGWRPEISLEDGLKRMWEEAVHEKKS